MSDFSKIQWETSKGKNPQMLHGGSDSFEYFLNYCKSKLPSQNLEHACDTFSKEKERLDEQMNKSIMTFSKEPLLAALLVWIKDIVQDSSQRLLAKILLENDLIGIQNESGQVWTLADAKNFDHPNVIEAIRCRRDWAFSLRENLVKCYLDFINWLAKATYGYIPGLEDPDLLRVQGRSLSYSIFIEFLSKLKEGDQLIAKLLYFGGSRTLDDVLTLSLEDVDFKNRIITYGMQPLEYPLHVFSDIKELSQGRKKGKVFFGRRGKSTALNPATIFRNFKEAAKEVGLGSEFTPKVLTTNK